MCVRDVLMRKAYRLVYRSSKRTVLIQSEVERARENLIQSGKPFAGPSRRDSMSMMGGPRPYSDFGK